MAEVDGLDGFATQAEALEQSLGGAQAMAAAFDAELGRMRESMIFTGREVSSLSNSIGRGLRSAFDGVVFDGLKLSDALKGLGQTMVDSVYAIAMKPIQNAVGGAIANGMNGLLSGLFPFEKGGAFTQGKVMPFAKGGVVGQPTMFPMRGGTRPDGRGGARSDHAFGTRPRRAAWGSGWWRWARRQCGDEHNDP